MITWVLLASRTRARIFVRQGRVLTPIRTLEHAQGRIVDQDIEANQSRRTFDGHARGHTGETSPHEHSAERFAKTLAHTLRTGRVESRVDRFVLVAEPHFLGLLYKEMDHTTASRVVASVSKELIAEDVDAVQVAVNEALSELDRVSVT
jgi:protein required for attachment to host cells